MSKTIRKLESGFHRLAQKSPEEIQSTKEKKFFSLSFAHFNNALQTLEDEGKLDDGMSRKLKRDRESAKEVLDAISN